MSRTKNDYRDAAMVAELLRTGKFTLTRLTYGPWADLRRTFAPYGRLADNRARQKTILRGAVDCLFPELTQVFKGPLQRLARQHLLAKNIRHHLWCKACDSYKRVLRKGHPLSGGEVV